MPERKRKRSQVPNACTSCRNAKLKCCGSHPICSRCEARGSACSYDVTEGLTKRQQQRLDLSTQIERLDCAMTLLNYLRRGTDVEAAEMLARLRCGATFDQEYRRIQVLRPSEPAVQHQRFPGQAESVSDSSTGTSLDDQDHHSADLLRPLSQPHDIYSGMPTSTSPWSHTMNYSGANLDHLIECDEQEWSDSSFTLDPQLLKQTSTPWLAQDSASYDVPSASGGPGPQGVYPIHTWPRPRTGGL